MNKILLIMGIIGCVFVTDSYAKVSNGQNQTHTALRTNYQCTEPGCTLQIDDVQVDDGTIKRHVKCVRLSYVDHVLQQDTECKEKPRIVYSTYRPQKDMDSTASRSAKIMVPQKIVYKEIYFDDSVDEIEE